MTSEQRVPKVKLSVDNASKSYDTKSGPLLAIDDFSMQVGEAEFVCVVGPSGCGKTTLLWSMAGLHSPSRGTVRLDGEPANVVTNDFVKPGNDFDKAKVQADADACKLSDDMAKVDVEKIRWNFYSNVIR